MNSSLGQLSAVAAMLQFSSNKQGIICQINRLVAILLSVAYSKENSGSYLTSTAALNFGHRKTFFIFLFCKQDSLLTATDYLLNRWRQVSSIETFVSNPENLTIKIC